MCEVFILAPTGSHRRPRDPRQPVTRDIALLWIVLLVDDSGPLAFACGCGRLRWGTADARCGRAAVVSARADVTPALSRGCEHQARQGPGAWTSSNACASASRANTSASGPQAFTPPAPRWVVARRRTQPAGAHGAIASPARVRRSGSDEVKKPEGPGGWPAIARGSYCSGRIVATSSSACGSRPSCRRSTWWARVAPYPAFRRKVAS